ncbi:MULTISPECIES: hypothetical protein [Pectobacterium]|uniref:hypothetical protein n=1 Tax=Pectobacterium TaxID=122277 RepID=UPI00193E5D6D|nr:hypothetical protein [Pectobacterium brasiliense]QRN32729.1 hypothetical protein IHJ54_12045 [Pectobacterium brasiliense]
MSSFMDIEIVIDTDGSPIDVEELTDFLYHFRAVYSVAIKEMEKKNYSIESDFQRSIRDGINDLDWREISNYAHAELGDNKLGIININRRNPLIIVFSGIAVALTTAVIISGGTLKMGPLSAKLPPLGKGIKELRTAFGRKPRLRHKNKKEI